MDEGIEVMGEDAGEEKVSLCRAGEKGEFTDFFVGYSAGVNTEYGTAVSRNRLH